VSWVGQTKQYKLITDLSGTSFRTVGHFRWYWTVEKRW